MAISVSSVTVDSAEGPMVKFGGAEFTMFIVGFETRLLVECTVLVGVLWWSQNEKCCSCTPAYP